jgi:hypothetical protein
MKYLRFLVAATTIILSIIGFSVGSFVLKLTEHFINKETLALSPLDSLTPHLSLGFLLAFCSLSAGVVLWAYNKTNLSFSPSLVFIVGLLVSLMSAFFSVWLYLRQLRFIESQFDTYENISLSVKVINYFSWGANFVFFVSGMIAIFFLWLPHLRGGSTDIGSTGQYVNKKYLMIGTVVFLVFALISLIGFLCRMLPTVLQ